MQKKIIEISDILELLRSDIIAVNGPIEKRYIDNLADFNNTDESTLDWISPNRVDRQSIAESSKAKVLLVDDSVQYSEKLQEMQKTIIVVKNPKTALAKVGNRFFVNKPICGIHPTAIIDKSARIGSDVYIGPYCVIGKVHIGDGCIISAHVCIHDNVAIGSHCFIKEGTIIGGAGFGFEKDNNGNRFRFPQIGGVQIGDYVEIGANTCIDRGALSDTIISDYVKISNHCQIAHNVQIGKNTVITACAELSGSCVIGDNVWIGPNVSVRDRRKIGHNSLIGIGGVVVKNVPENEVWGGNPAKKLREKLDSN